MKRNILNTLGIYFRVRDLIKKKESPIQTLGRGFPFYLWVCSMSNICGSEEDYGKIRVETMGEGETIDQWSTRKDIQVRVFSDDLKHCRWRFTFTLWSLGQAIRDGSPLDADVQ